MKNIINLILKTDSYKLGHWQQYPTGMRKVYSYMESRGGLFPKTLFSGLDIYTKKYLQGNVVTMEDIDYAEKFTEEHLGRKLFNREKWEYIVNKYDGKLPIRIKAVKEGSLVPVGNVLMTIESTDHNCYWLTNTLETMLMKLWYPTTVATNGFYSKLLISQYLNKTAENNDSAIWKLHDFGYRGVSSEETAGIGGMAHLINFRGSDTIEGILYAREYYNEHMAGFSVPASEHSVATSFGRDFEEEYFLNMLKHYPEGIVSIVSDTYNVFKFIEVMSDKYRDKILERDGTVVFRPDSGHPVDINSRLIDLLWNKFGGTYVNGYKLLDSHVRLIQGDGIDIRMINDILHMAELKGYSADNWVFGSGGALLQKWTRDTNEFAIKASYGEIEVDGEVSKFPISKDPITSKSKRSKGGKLKLIPTEDSSFLTISSENSKDKGTFSNYIDSLEVVFENGEIKREQTLENIRNIADNHLEVELKENYDVISKLNFEKNYDKLDV